MMFLPLFIAILLGFVSPSSSNNHKCNRGTVVVNSAEDPGDDGGDDDTGGEGSHTPPIPPKPPTPPKTPE